MSQHNSSMVSSGIPNSQAKYQKALKQISKLINTNKILKNQCQQRQQILGSQLSQVAMRLEQVQKKYEQSQQQKRKMQQYIESLQDTNQDLRKQYQTMQRQVGYLNDVLSQQNQQLKKLSAFKDQKGIAQLFKSYEERQNSYKKDVSRLQQNILNLKTTIDRLESDLTQQTEMRQRYEDQYNIVGLEINKYRQLNNYLMNQNESILNDQHNDNKTYAKQQELQSFVYEFKRQLQTMRNIKYESEDVGQKQYVKNYELLLQQKNAVAIELAKTRDQLNICQQKINQFYQIENKMSTAVSKSQTLTQQNNMLRNRITILQSKQMIESAAFDQDSQLKDMQQKINFMMAKSDPLITIKNGDDNSHFIAMKSFIADLQIKLQSVIQQKQTFERKYKNLKLKFSKVAQEKLILDDSNKLLKGKLQGYERLAEKLHYQLERSMHAHEDQIVKMVAITNNLVGRKVQESKTTSAFIKGQFDVQIQKAQKVQKTLSQQVQSLKLQTSTQRIKITDLQQRLKQSNQFIQIYQQKMTQVSDRYKQLQNQNSQLNQNLLKYEQLYQEEKTRHETILIQKQNLSSRLNLLNDQFNQRSYKWEEQSKRKQQQYQSENRRIKGDITKYKQEVETVRQQNKRLLFQLDERRIKQNSNLVSLKNENHYYSQLQRSYNQLKQINHSLQTQIISIKHKLDNYEELNKKLSEMQYELIKKNDQLNDQKRQSINLKRQIQGLSMDINDLKSYNQQLSQEINSLNTKIHQQLNNTISSSRYSASSNSDIESRKKIQKLNQQIALLQSAIRDQKRNTSRVSSELQRYKQQVQALQNTVSKAKSREQSLINTVNQNSSQISRLQDQIVQYKSRYSHSSHNLQTLNHNLEQINQKVAKLSEQLGTANNRVVKTQNKYNNLFRDLMGTKYQIKQAQKIVKRLNSVQGLQWDQQRQKENLASLLQTLNRIIQSNQSALQLTNSGGSNQQYSFVPASSFGNLQSNYLTNNSAGDYTKISFSGGSFGKDQLTRNNIVTNDSFGGYKSSTNYQSIANVNYSSDQFDTVYGGRGHSINEYRLHQQQA